MEFIPIHELDESAHPEALGSSLYDEVLDRYEDALTVPPQRRTNDDWAIIVAVREAAPDLARTQNIVNYYSGENNVPQLRPAVQGGAVNQP